MGSEYDQENGVEIDGLDDIEMVNTSIDDIDSEEVNLIFVGIDQSGSMDPYERDMKDSLENFKQALTDSKEADQILVARANFDSYIDIGGYKKIVEFGTNYRAGGMTTLYDVICDGSKALKDYLDFLKNEGAAISEKNVVFVPFYRDTTIKQKAGELYGKCEFMTNDVAGEVLAKLFPDIKIRFEDLNLGMLGFFSFDERVITISNEIIADEHRRNFTLAHEIGHLCLHEPYLRNHAKKFVDYSTDSIKLLQDDLVKMMEVQANSFASYLLMPQTRLINEVNRVFKLMDIRTGRFYLDNQMCNIKDVETALRSLSDTFNVSKEAIKYRLIKERLLIDNSRGPRRINQIFKKW